MVCIGAVPKPPSDEEDTERPRKKSKKSSSDGTEGPSEPRGPPIGLVFWSCIALDGDMIMPPKAMSEARMREIIRDQVTTSMNEFMANMNRGAGGAGAGGAGAGGAGAGGAGAGGAGADGAGNLGVVADQLEAELLGAMGSCQWFEKIGILCFDSDFREKDKIEIVQLTLFHGRCVTWWNRRMLPMGIDAANGSPWVKVE
ncbi:hypothetical protein Tco_1003418 [Tanacetum coccineum]|uniref:Uncharacterized protein n=1 Tax=Tanacetum coccineum TaxID=301880 RepID=A0ABQ5F9E2_9ASTR